MRLLTLCLLLMLAPASFADDPADAEYRRARQEIGNLLQAGQGARALAAIEPWLESRAGDAMLHALHGEALHALERHGEATEAFARAAALDPTLRGRMFNHGRALQALGRHNEAIAVFEAMRGEEEAVRRAQGAFGIGLSRLALGDEPGAAEAFRETIALDPTSQRARYRLALIDIAAGRDAEAEAALATVLAADPLHHGAAYNRALALGRLGRAEESDAAWARYRQVLEGKQRISLLEERLTGGPDDGERLLEIGRVNAELGAQESALEWYQRAAGLLPRDPRPALGAVASLRALGRIPEAEQLCTMLLSLTPPIEELRVPLIEMLEARGAKEEADRWRRSGE